MDFKRFSAFLGALLLLSVFATAAEPTANNGAVVVGAAGNTTTFLLLGLVLIILAAVIFFIFRQPIINTILGLVVFAILNFIGIHVPVNLVTILITAIFGLLGIGVLVILTVLGLI